MSDPACGTCRQPLFPEDRYCGSCGRPVSAQLSVTAVLPSRSRSHSLTRLQAMKGSHRVCASCKSPLLEAETFCAACGAPQSAEGVIPDPVKKAQSVWDELLDELRHETLGDYDIHGLLGRGGMAAVFLAHEIALDRKVAIKVMSPSLMVDPVMIERFGHEARTMAALQHPHIVHIHSVRSVERLYFFVMQFVEGCPLSDLIAGGLPIPVVQSLLHQVCAALEYAHSRKVVHRDIKPGNIMVDTNGDALVTDFGIAKVVETTGHTLTGTIIGTPAYMSPEQCLAGTLSGASDQYSLGVVAYQMLARAAPFGGSPLQMQMAHLQTPPPPIRDRQPECPPELEAAVLRMLAKDPVDRFPSMLAAAHAIGGGVIPEGDLDRVRLRERVSKGLREFAPTPPSPVKVARAQRRVEVGPARRRPLRRAVLVGGVMILLGGAAFGIWSLNRPGSPVSQTLPAATDGSGPTDPLAPEPPSSLIGPRPAPPPPTVISGSTEPRPAPSPEPERPRTAQVDSALRAPPPPAPAATLDSERAQGARALILEYGAAINRRDLPRMKQLYPGMDRQMSRDWENLFPKDVKDLAARIELGDEVRLSGATAVASFRIVLRFTPPGARADSVRLRCDVVLEEAGGRWTFRTIQQRGM